MSLTPLDWVLLAASFGLPFAIGMALSRRGGRSVTDYFLGGRRLSWWLAGTSMVATTFAADTPLAVAGLVGRQGIAGNWIWWGAALGSTLTACLFARLWRRTGVLTDVELAELRYSGRPAALLRLVRALYLGLPINCVIMGWVNLAMAKVLAVSLGWDAPTAVFLSLACTGAYVSLAGLWGVVAADLVQFALAMAGSIALAWFALRAPAIGGLDGLAAAVPEGALDFVPWPGVPAAGGAIAALPAAAFLTHIGVQWWASWYPGQEPGGGGYIAQRILSARDERHARLAAVWFTVAHYCVRPWPWIVVGLASLVLYPDLADREAGYVLVLRDHLPAGWRGLLLGAFVAAYMSTISTQLNWGTSYLVNDVYRRFVRPGAAERHYVLMSRLVTLVLMALSAWITFHLDSIRAAWEFVLESGAGIGLVLILRWYWWRVNAWSEIAALVAAAVGFAAVKLATPLVFPHTLLAVTAWTTICWLVATLATSPEPESRLQAFYLRVRPEGPGWAHVARQMGGPPPAPLAPLLLDWAACATLVYALLFATGALLFHSAREMAVSGAVAAVCAWRLASRGSPSRSDTP